MVACTLSEAPLSITELWILRISQVWLPHIDHVGGCGGRNVCSSSPWSEWMQRAVMLESGVMVVIRGVPVAYRVCLFLTLGEVVEMLPVENEQVWHKWETCQEVHRCSAGVKKERHRERRARVNKRVLLEHHADVQQPQLIDAFKAPYHCPLSCPQTLFTHLCFLSPSQHLKYHIYGWRIGF